MARVDAVVVVASDNGGCSLSGAYNHPLRGGKQYLYEGGVRVNAFVHSPLLPLANALGLFLLDFDVYLETRDADATAEVLVPALRRFFGGFREEARLEAEEGGR